MGGALAAGWAIAGDGAQAALASWRPGVGAETHCLAYRSRPVGDVVGQAGV